MDYIHWLFLMRCGLVGCLFILFISLISFRRLVPVPHLNLGCWFVGSHFVGYGYDDSKLFRFYGILFSVIRCINPPYQGVKAYDVYIYIYPRGAKWFQKGVNSFSLSAHWRFLEGAWHISKTPFWASRSKKKHVFTKKQLQKKIIRYQLGFILI